GRREPLREDRSARTGRARRNQRTCSSQPAFPLRRGVAGEHLGTPLKSVVDGLLVTRAGVGDRTQAPPAQQRLYLLEAGQIVCGFQGLVVLCSELGPMRWRKGLIDRGRVLPRVTGRGRFHMLSSHTANLSSAAGRRRGW